MIRITLPHLQDLSLRDTVSKQVWITDEDTGRVVAEAYGLDIHVFEDVKHYYGRSGRRIKTVKKPKEITITIRCRAVPSDSVLALEQQKLIPKL